MCTFCLYSLKDCNCSFHFSDVFDVLIGLVIVEETVFVRAKETQLSAILWSREPFLPPQNELLILFGLVSSMSS